MVEFTERARSDIENQPSRPDFLVKSFSDGSFAFRADLGDTAEDLRVEGLVEHQGDDMRVNVKVLNEVEEEITTNLGVVRRDVSGGSVFRHVFSLVPFLTFIYIIQ